ncbi:alpha/beta hydrolase family protein [Sphingomonas sp. MA1305]|uniref:alpha/beta hydrolase family protein n=1 Tax=Sphingomonas sp. MA1305 TaxID=2479204 RepID=UPI0018DF5464
MTNTSLHLRRASALLVLAVVAPVSAQTNVSGEQAARLFGSRERIIDASLSPDGSKVAIVAPGPQQSAVVQIIDVKTGEAKPINYANGAPMTLTGCGWASVTRLVCTLYGVSNVQGGWESYSRLIGMDADGSNLLPLGVTQRVQDYVSYADGHVIDWRDGKTDQVLIARNYVPLKANVITIGSKAQGLGVDLLDTRTGNVSHVESADPIVTRYFADGQGHIRIKAQLDSLRQGYTFDGRVNYYYRVNDSREWKPFSTFSQMEDKGMTPLAVDGAANVAYALDRANGRQVLYRVALDGTLAKTVALADDAVDIDGVTTVGRHGRVIGAVMSKERREARYFDHDYETLVTKLGRALSSTPIISIIDSSADEKTHLIYAASDTNAGEYYVYDSAGKKLVPIGAVRPDLSGLALGKMQAITYKASDGTTIPAYLTLPAGNTGKGLPAIVMPHGGPASRDEWGFDWLVQFFANRGYAVIQPNYRGSTGYGQEWFQQNGFKSWKVAIGDVADAGRWLVKEGIADPKKLAIVGWSYGGYAALQSQVLAPDLFKAAVAIAPVTDLGALRAERGGFDKVGRDFIGEGPQLDEGSPARHADAFRAPVLMFHGSKDINVSVNESKLMDRQLHKAGKRSELIVYPAIDHQLRDSAVRVDMLTRTDAFLTQALK